MNHDGAKAVLLAQIAGEPALTRPQSRRRAQIALGIGGVAAVGVFGAFGGVHAGGRPIPFIIVCALTLVVLAVRSSMLALAAMAAIAVNYAVAADGVADLHADLGCIAFATVFSLIFSAASMIAFRSSDPVRPERRGVLLAITAVTLAAMLVFLLCSHENARHFAFAHIGSALVWGVIIALVARRVVAVR
ncbi:MAG: DUF1109 family protein [Clostridia bacterium]|nr:DUF1109 family protein [Deltaproteobacteria bacterium]